MQEDYEHIVANLGHCTSFDNKYNDPVHPYRMTEQQSTWALQRVEFARPSAGVKAVSLTCAVCGASLGIRVYSGARQKALGWLGFLLIISSVPLFYHGCSSLGTGTPVPLGDIILYWVTPVTSVIAGIALVSRIMSGGAEGRSEVHGAACIGDGWRSHRLFEIQ